MQTSQQWYNYFNYNLQQQRIDWNIQPNITIYEIHEILASMQAWQLGETSDGSNLIKAAILYSKKVNDPFYVEAIKLFIKEEQKHGNNLGKYLDAIGQPHIKRNWGDSLFRWARHFNTSMHWWTLTVITVENAAQVYYQCLKQATSCQLLQQICTDILIDEAPHIRFQQQRFATLFSTRPTYIKPLIKLFYYLFYCATSVTVYAAHKKVFNAGGVGFKKYCRKMMFKYAKTIGRLGKADTTNNSFHQKFKMYETTI